MKMRNSKVLLLFISTMVVCGCNNGGATKNASTNQATAHVDKKLATSIDAIRPGLGYSTLLGELSSEACYNASAHQSGQTGELHTSMEFGANSFRKSMSAELSGGTTFSNPFAEVNVVASFTGAQDDSDVSTSLYFTHVIKRKVNVSVDSNQEFWTTFGANQYQRLQNGEIDINTFSQLCGDRLISSFNEIATLVIKLTFHFATAEENYKFRTEYEYKSIFSHMEGKVEAAFDLKQLHGSLSVDAFQFGGEPEQLANVLANVNGVTTCNFDNLYSCDSLISSLYQYGSTFSTQFNQNTSNSDYELSKNMIPTGEIVPGNPFSMYYKDIPPLEIESSLTKARNQLVADTEMINNGYNVFSGIMVNNNSLQSIASYGELEYMKLYYKKLTNIYNEFHRNTGDERAMDCWSQPDMCEKISNKFHQQIKNFQIYLLKLNTTSNAAEGINHEVAILDLDDPAEYGNNLHFIRIFNIKNGLYVGKIPYLDDKNSSIFDNVGRSIAAGYAQEPSVTYNNGYFFTGLSDVKLNMSRFIDSDKYHEYVDDAFNVCREYYEVQNSDGTWTKEGPTWKTCMDNYYAAQSGEQLLADEYAEKYLGVKGCLNIHSDSMFCVPGDFYSIDQAENNELVKYDSRLIISKYNNPLEYKGNGEILMKPDINVALHKLTFSPEVIDLLDPVELSSSYVSNLVRDNSKIYYASKLQADPRDCLSLYQVTTHMPATIYPAYDIKIDYCQYMAYHEGSELPLFKLEFSVLGNQGDYDDKLY